MESTPAKRRWFRFGLSHLFVLTLGIALGFAPLKLWELNTRGEPRIWAHVQAIEIPRDRLAELGLSSSRLSSGGIRLADLEQSFSEQLATMRHAGQAKILAEPTLATVSGHASMFNVGAQIPVPVSNPDGSIWVNYQDIGTRIDLTPTLLRNGRIRLEFRSTISAAKNDVSAVLDDSVFPALHYTSAEAEIDLKDGETVLLCANSAEASENNEKTLLILATVEKAKAR
jgi:Flp pilus assembly secretin CpaC